MNAEDPMPTRSAGRDTVSFAFKFHIVIMILGFTRHLPFRASGQRSYWFFHRQSQSEHILENNYNQHDAVGNLPISVKQIGLARRKDATG